MVARYNVGNDIDPETYGIETGEYVLYSDYAKLEEALRGCVEAIDGLGRVVAEVDDASNNWHDNGHVGSRMTMFRIAHAVENPEASVATTKAGVVQKKAREVLGDD